VKKIGGNARGDLLETKNLGARRGGAILLENISWRVQEGEHWVILGGNGSGKTSLLSALTGYLTASSGDIFLLGQQFGAADWRQLRRHIGFVSSSIRQRMAETETALESVAGGKYAMIDFWGPVKRSDRKQALAILRQVECDYLAARPWAVLSQGERQRVLIGRALMSQPRILVLDEPCAGLDPVARERFLNFLQRRGNEPDSPALLLVTHHVEEIMPVFTHVLLLKNGRLHAAGKKETVLTSKILSEAFDADLRLRKTSGRYAMEFPNSERGNPIQNQAKSGPSSAATARE
jgi:iron complex transport system ATP-binding protein